MYNKRRASFVFIILLLTLIISISSVSAMEDNDVIAVNNGMDGVDLDDTTVQSDENLAVETVSVDENDLQYSNNSLKTQSAVIDDGYGTGEDSNGKLSAAAVEEKQGAGETYNIYVAEDGNDNNDGSIDAPVKTIKAAVELAQAGDVIYIYDGTYDAQPSGSSTGVRLFRVAGDITIIGQSRDGVIINGATNGRTFSTGSASNAFTGHVKLVNLTVQNAKSGTSYAAFDLSNNNGINELVNCTYKDSEGLMAIKSGAANTIITNCDFVNDKMTGNAAGYFIYLTNANSVNTIANVSIRSFGKTTTRVGYLIHNAGALSVDNLTVIDTDAMALYGVYAYGADSKINLTNSEFTSNDFGTTTTGGALFGFNSNGLISVSSSVIGDNHFRSGILRGSSASSQAFLNYNYIYNNTQSVIYQKDNINANIDYNYWNKQELLYDDGSEIAVDNLLVLDVSQSPFEVTTGDEITIIADLKESTGGALGDLRGDVPEIPVTFQYNGETQSDVITDSSAEATFTVSSDDVVVINDEINYHINLKKVYVRGSDGVDDSEHGSYENPYKTIGYAVSQAQNGDIIYIFEGDYTENSITLNKDLTLMGENNNVNITGATGSSIFLGTSTYSYNFFNLNFNDNNIGTNTNNAVLSLRNKGNNTVVNCTFNRNTGKFMIMSEGAYTLISNCVFDENIISVKTSGVLLNLKGSTTMTDVNITNTASNVDGYVTLIQLTKGNLDMDNIIISGNEAKFNLFRPYSDTNTVITNSKITDNVLIRENDAHGGYMFNTASIYDNLTVTITDSIIANNSIAQAMIYGSKDTASFTFNNNLIYDNTGYTTMNVVPNYDFNYNYWGDNEPVLTSKDGTLDLDNYIIVEASHNPATVLDGKQVTVKAELKLNRSGEIEDFDGTIPEVPISIEYKGEKVDSSEATFTFDKEYENATITAINAKINETILLKESTIYVSDADGSDEDGLGTKDKPYKTISKAISESEDDFTIYLYEGNYTVTTAYALSKSLTFVGENENAVITGSYSGDFFRVPSSASSKSFKFINLTFADITGSTSYSYGIIDFDYGNSLDIINCTFRDIRVGNVIRTAVETNIDNCIFEDINLTTGTGAVLYITSNSPKYTVENTIFTKIYTTASGLGNVIRLTRQSTELYLDNITISNVDANSYGAAVHMNSQDCTVVVNNSRIVNNNFKGQDSSSSYYGNDGGAIFTSQKNYATITVTNSIIENNTVKYGIVYAENNNAEVNVNYNIIVNNTGKPIYNKSSTRGVYNIDYNYWGNNTPVFEDIVPANYVILAIEGSDFAEANTDNIYNITLNQLNDTSALTNYLPEYSVEVTSNYGTAQNVVIKDGKGQYIYNPSTKLIDIITAGDVEKVVNDIVPVAILNITKAVDNDEPYVGDNVKFTIVVSNKGNMPATNITVKDTLPEGLVFNSTDAEYSQSGNVITWTIASLDANDDVSIELIATVNATGDLINEVTAICDENDTEVSATANLTSTVAPCVILNITKIADNDNPSFGNIVNFTISIVNEGNIAATNVNVKDILPAALVLISSDVAPTEDDQLTWIIPSLDVGEIATIVLSTKVVDVGEITNEVTAFAAENETEVQAQSEIVAKGFEGNELYVSADAETSGDGTLENPFKTITEAVDLANTAENPVTIYILEGTYSDVNMTISNTMTIRNYNASNVVIDANKKGWVFYADNRNNNLTLIGLTINNGNKDVKGDSTNGGVVKTEGHLDVYDCVFNNNTAYGNGGAILVKANGADIINSTFSNSQTTFHGGAVHVDGGLNLINSTFTDNQAKWRGGAVKSVMGDTLIDNCTFIGNIAERRGESGYGGAVCVQAGSLEVINSKFINNTAYYSGGAIDTDYGDDSEGISAYTLNIDNSTFIANKAPFGSAVATAARGINMTNSILSGNGVDSSTMSRYGRGAVYVKQGDSILTRNVILDNVNDNDGRDVFVVKGNLDANYNWWGDNNKPTSEKVAIDGTGVLSLDNWVVLTAENDNNVNITARLDSYSDGSDVYKLPDDIPEIIRNVTYLSPDVTPNVTDTTGVSIYSGDGDEIVVSVDNQLLAIPIVKTSADPVTLGENAIIIVDLIGNITIEINNASWPAVSNEEYSIAEIPDLPVGEHNYTVNYVSDDKFVKASVSSSLTVNKASISIEATDAVTKVDENASTTAVLNMSDATGTVSITVDGVDYSAEVEDGSAVVVLPLLPAGNYTFDVVYSGDDRYESNSTSVSVTVEKYAIDFTKAKGHPGRVDKNATVDVILSESDATGTVSINIGGVDYSAELVDGAAVIYAPLLPAGTYNADVVYSGDDKYENNTAPVTFNVNKYYPTMKATAASVRVDENATVNVALPDDATGTVTITVDGVDYTAEVVDGTAAVVLPAISEAGPQAFDVAYSGDDKYRPYITDVEFNVLKCNANMKASARTVKVGDDVTVNVALSDDATGEVSIDINGTVYTGTVEDGAATIVIPDLPYGQYALEVQYSGDDKYKARTATVTFNVNKQSTTMKATARTVKVGDNVTVNVKLASDVTGEVVITVNDVDYTATVEDGVATIVLPDLPAGQYALDVKYGGDDKYKNQSTTVKFNVNKYNVRMKVTPTYYYDDDFAIISTVLSEDATGDVSVNINGDDYFATISNGKVLIAIPALPAGDYTFDVVYSGDAKYNNYTVSKTLNVDK